MYGAENFRILGARELSTVPRGACCLDGAGCLDERGPATQGRCDRASLVQKG